MKRLRALRPLFVVMLAPGTIVHEISHYIMCRSLGVRVQKVQLLIFTKAGMEGHVYPYPIRNSFLKPLLIAIAPSIINTGFACMLIMIAPLFVEEWVSLLLSWLVVSVVLMCGPSREDLAFAFKSITRYPGRTLKELGFVAIGVVCGLCLYSTCLQTVGVALPPFIVATFSILTIAILCIL